MKRVRTDLFQENRREEEFMELQRQWSRGENSKGSRERESRDFSRNCRRVKTSDNNYSPPSGRTPCSSSMESSQREGRNKNSSIIEAVGSLRSTINLQDQDEIEMVGYGDFRGVYQEDLNSRYRELIRRIKRGYVSDPTMSGKILNQPSGRWHKFCCDTGCSTNLMPAKMAALNGLKWSPVDPDEPQYRSVTNQKLEVIGQTSCFVKKPVKLSFIVCLEDGNEALLSVDTLKELSIVS